MLCLQVTKGKGRGRKRILCFTGLSRPTETTLGAAMTHARPADMKVHTIFIYEDDPKLVDACQGIKDLAEAGSMHTEPVVIAVPAHGAQARARRGDSDSSSDDEEGSFSRRVTSLKAHLVSVGCNNYREKIGVEVCDHGPVLYCYFCVRNAVNAVLNLTLTRISITHTTLWVYNHEFFDLCSVCYVFYGSLISIITKCFPCAFTTDNHKPPVV